MTAIRIDESRSPLIIVTFPVSTNDAEFDDYLERMQRRLALRKKSVVIMDARVVTQSHATQRAKQAEWLKTNRELLRLYSCGTAFVIRSAIVRGGLTAILWVAPIPSPHTVVATIEEAEQWALARLRADGVAFPDKTPAAG
jgi:hypothetical protein